MRNSTYTTCDGCGTIIDGRDGTAVVKSTYITIKGSLRLNYYDSYGVQHHAYDRFRPAAEDTVGRKPFLDYEYYDFCSGFCLDDFMETRLIMKAKYHEDNNLPPINLFPKKTKKS